MNGKLYTLGKTYYSVGMDMGCRRVITACKLMEVREPDAHGRDCVVRCEGINVLFRLSDLYERKLDIKV
jgi:hypothetical protein